MLFRARIRARNGQPTPPPVRLTPYPPLLEWRRGPPGGFRRPGGAAPMKCQKCTKQATLHITEVISDDHFEELHLCEDCAQKYIHEPQQSASAGKASR